MKTIAQQLNIEEFPFEIKDKNGRIIYYEFLDGFFARYERDKRGNVCFYETSEGFSYTCEYDENGYVRYFENSNGEIRDKRVKEMTIAQIENALNIKNLKIVK